MASGPFPALFTSLRDGNRPHRIVGLTQQRYIYIYIKIIYVHIE